MTQPHTQSIFRRAGIAVLVLSAGTAGVAAQTDGGVLTPTRSATTEPVRSTLPGGLEWLTQLDGVELGLAAPSLLPEGTVLVRRPGRVSQPRPGVWVFRPDDEDRRAGEGAMLLMPSESLARLVSFAGDTALSDRFTLTGRVYQYRGLNLILPSAFAPLLDAPDPPLDQSPSLSPELSPAPSPDGAAEPPTEPADTPNPAGQTPPREGSDALDPDVDDLLRELDRASSLAGGAARGLTPDGVPTPSGDAPAGTPAATPSDSTPTAAPTRVGQPESQLVGRLVGRLVRLSDGRFGFAVDHGTGPSSRVPAGGVVDQPAGPDGRAYIIQYCRALEVLERYALTWGSGLEIEMSGLLMSFEDRAYLLPTTYRVLPPSDLDPMPGG